MAFQTKSKLKNLIIHINCIFLYLRNLIFRQKLSVKRVIFVNNLNILNNEVEFLFDVTGCHKILVKDLGIFPGKTSSLQYVFQGKKNSIEITFFGYGGHKETKELRFEATLIKLIDKFNITTTTPQLSSTYIGKQNLKCVFSDTLNLTKKASISINIQPQHLISNNLNADLEPFIKSNYLTETF
jgi:hypothetical protein